MRGRERDPSSKSSDAAAVQRGGGDETGRWRKRGRRFWRAEGDLIR
jgi:hypothetical protein